MLTAVLGAVFSVIIFRLFLLTAMYQVKHFDRFTMTKNPVKTADLLSFADNSNWQILCKVRQTSSDWDCCLFKCSCDWGELKVTSMKINGCVCKIYLYFTPVCWVRLPNDSQKDNCDGIPQDPVRVREELHLQNVPLPIHQQLFELNLHSILQGSILHRPRRRKCQIQLYFKVDFILKDCKYKTIAKATTEKN